MHRRWRWVLGLGAILVALPATGVPLAWAAQEINIQATEYVLAPEQITVRVGEPVFLRLHHAGTSRSGHNLRIDALNIQLRENLSPGQSGTLELNFTRPGTYAFYCPTTDHKDRGMVGKLTVVAAGAALPAQLPRTGDELAPYLLGIAGLGLALMALGARLRRSGRPTA
ncbi:MAG: cupredoxin domain-containing protein [Chloroflexi bacterium]|nr:cupredoxin domain-containing protein [Chloroflexota bacterium]